MESNNSLNLNLVCSNIDEFQELWNTTNRKLEELKERKNKLQNYLDTRRASVNLLRMQTSKLEGELNWRKQREYEKVQDIEKYSDIINVTKADMAHREIIHHEEDMALETMVGDFEEECYRLVLQFKALNPQSENEIQNAVKEIEEEMPRIEKSYDQLISNKNKPLPFYFIQILIIALSQD